MIAVSPDRYTAFMLRHRWLVLASAVAVMLVLTAGLQFITISNDWRDMLDEDNPQLVAFDTLEDTYTATNAAVIAVAPKGGSVFTREALGAVEELTEAAWRVPSSTRVDSLTNYTHTESVEDDLNVERLVDDAGSLSDDDLARIERIALGEPSVAGRLVSHDGRVAGLAISFALPENSNAAVVESLRDNAWPVFLTTATTMIGFLSLNASDSPPFRVLGNLVAFGMLSAFVYSMTLLPALLLVLPLRARPVRAGRFAFFDRFGAFVVARRTLLLWSMPWRPACPASS